MKKNRILRLGIVGHGFVGKATDYGFYKDVEKFIVDPYLKTDIDQLSKFRPDIIFVCVPTPMGNNGHQDTKILLNVITELSAKCFNSIVVIKSTVLPNTLEKLLKINKSIIYNPEFLREKHANEDFKNSEILIFGGNKELSKKISQVYLKNSRCKTKEHIFTDLKTASLIKYSVNTFLAAKVVYFNEIYSLYKDLGVNDSWEKFTEILSKDRRIGSSHMMVPGHDGKKGFGGACFPKDSLALAKYAGDRNIDLTVLKKVIQTNNKIRSEYSDLDTRETEQNVSFDDKI